MPRPLLAAALVAALVGCGKKGPAEPSEADAKEAYVAYKALAEKSRAASDAYRKAVVHESHLSSFDTESLSVEARKEHAEGLSRAKSLSEKKGVEFSEVNDKAIEMERVWSARWARLGFSLEPLTVSPR